MKTLLPTVPHVACLLSSLALACCGGSKEFVPPLGVSTSAPPVGSAPSAPRAPNALHTFRTESVEYEDGATKLEGYFAYPTDIDAAAKLPAILVFHDWMGLTAEPKRRAEKLAELGYVGFAADVFGKDVRPTTTEEAAKLATRYKADRPTMRARGEAALKKVTADARVDPRKIVAIGYCFGGTAALELARNGNELAGVVSFHGGLDSPHPEDAKNIKGRVLALHGGDDPFVKADEVLAFEDEMRKAKVDWQVVAYGNAVHSFTIKSAGSDPTKGAAYNEKADMRSWAEMRRFLDEIWH